MKFQLISKYQNIGAQFLTFRQQNGAIELTNNI